MKPQWIPRISHQHFILKYSLYVYVWDYVKFHNTILPLARGLRTQPSSPPLAHRTAPPGGNLLAQKHMCSSPFSSSLHPPGSLHYPVCGPWQDLGSPPTDSVPMGRLLLLCSQNRLNYFGGKPARNGLNGSFGFSFVRRASFNQPYCCFLFHILYMATGCVSPSPR